MGASGYQASGSSADNLSAQCKHRPAEDGRGGFSPGTVYLPLVTSLTFVMYGITLITIQSEVLLEIKGLCSYSGTIICVMPQVYCLTVGVVVGGSGQQA